MPPAQNKKIVQRMLDAFNSGNMELVDRVVSKDHVDETPFPGTPANRDGLKKQIAALREAFPDAKFSVEKITAQGDTVAFRWKMVGTNRGPFMGQRATNKQVTQFGTDFVTIRDGLIVAHDSSKNMGDLLAKLGLPADTIRELIP